MNAQTQAVHIWWALQILGWEDNAFTLAIKQDSPKVKDTITRAMRDGILTSDSVVFSGNPHRLRSLAVEALPHRNLGAYVIALSGMRTWGGPGVGTGFVSALERIARSFPEHQRSAERAVFWLLEQEWFSLQLLLQYLCVLAVNLAGDEDFDVPLEDGSVVRFPKREVPEVIWNFLYWEGRRPQEWHNPLLVPAQVVLSEKLTRIHGASPSELAAQPPEWRPRWVRR